MYRAERTPTLSFAQTAPGQVTAQLTLNFESNGDELQGRLAQTVPVWKCGSFNVEKSRCGSVDVNCFLGVIGDALRASASFMLGSGWVEGSIAGPDVALSGNIDSPSVTMKIALGTENGHVVARQTTAELNGTFSLRAAGMEVLPLSADVVQQWIRDEVNRDLTASMTRLNAGSRFANPIDGLATYGNPGLPQGLYKLATGGVIVDRAKR